MSDTRSPHLVVLTGAGISAESGLKTFRDGDGLWENHRLEDVATPEAWARNLDVAFRLGVSHLSAYHLTYEAGTSLHRQLLSGRIHAVSEDVSVNCRGSSGKIPLGIAIVTSRKAVNSALVTKRRATRWMLRRI